MAASALAYPVLLCDNATLRCTIASGVVPREATVNTNYIIGAVLVVILVIVLLRLI